MSRWNTDSRAALAHYVLLAAGALWIALCARGQWFFYDEWAFLVEPDASGLMAPHVGHWSLSPILITELLRSIFGLSTYVPYLAVAVLIHLGIAHLLWRALRRLGTHRWVAVALAFLFTVLGIGSENILWAFQIGFMGAILLGLGAVLVADVQAPKRPWIAFIGFVVLTTASLTFSGTALPLLAAAALVAWRRHGLRRAVVMLLPAVVVYGCWYVYATRSFDMAKGGRVDGFGQLLTGVPQYAAKMFVDALQLLTPIPSFGIILFTIVLIAAVARFTSLWRTRPIALALLLGGLVFALLTGFSRINNGFEATLQGRYVYMMLTLMFPLIGVILTVAIRRRMIQPTLAVALVLATAVYNAGVMRVTASAQSERELNTRDILYAAAAIVEDPSWDIPDDAKPEPVFAPDVTVASLRMLVERGWLTPHPYSSTAYLTAIANLTPETETVATVEDCPVLPNGGTPVGEDPVFAASGPASFQLVAGPSVGAPTGQGRAVDLTTGTTTVELDPHFVWTVVGPEDGSVRLCDDDLDN